MKPKIIILSCALITLILINASIYKKERHLEQGDTVYLALAPKDPRSLMAGDYMTLRFALAQEIYRAHPKKDPKSTRRFWAANATYGNGYVVVTLDLQKKAQFARIDDGSPLAANELRLRYRARGGRIKLATNAFHFQEGHAKYYEPARFGEFKVDASGELLLTSLFDDKLNDLKLTTMPPVIDTQ